MENLFIVLITTSLDLSHRVSDVVKFARA